MHKENFLMKFLSYSAVSLMIISTFVFETSNTIIIWKFSLVMFCLISFLTIYMSKKIYINLYLIWATIIIGFSLVPLIYKNVSISGLNTSIIFFKNVLLSIMLSQFLGKKINYDNIMKIIIVGGLVIFLNFLTDFDFHKYSTIDIKYSTSLRLGSQVSGNNPNIAAFNLFFSLICCIYFLLKRKYKFFYFIISSCILFAIFLTGSRKILLISVICCYLLAFILSKRKILMSFIVTITGSIGYFLLLNIPILYNLIGHKFDIFNPTVIYNESDQIRNMLIQEGVRVISNNLGGIGFDNFKFLNGFMLYSHNNYIEIMCGVGIIGGILYFTLYGYIVYNLIKLSAKKDEMASLLLVIMIGILVVEYAQVTYVYRMLHFILIICITYIEHKKCQ